MLTYSFLEWVKIKESLLDEARRTRTISKRNVMSEDGTSPNEGDFIVFDPILFFNKAIAAAKAGDDINPSDQDLNIGILSQRQGTTGIMHKIGGDIHPEIYVIPDNFRDVTDAFDSAQIPPGRRLLVYMGLRRYAGSEHKDTHASARGLYNKWRAIKSSNIDPSLVAVTGAIKDQDAAKGEVIKAGRKETNQWYKKRAADAAQGEDVTADFKGPDLTPGLVRHLRSIGAGAIVDQLHQKGLPVPGEENGPPQKPLSDFEKMFQPSQQQEPMSVPTHGFEPGTRNVIPTNPQQLQAIGQAKQPPSRDEIMRRNLQKLFPGGKLDVAHYNPMISLRGWKMHNDTRYYPYYPA